MMIYVAMKVNVGDRERLLTCFIQKYHSESGTVVLGFILSNLVYIPLKTKDLARYALCH